MNKISFNSMTPEQKLKSAMKNNKIKLITIINDDNRGEMFQCSKFIRRKWPRERNGSQVTQGLPPPKGTAI